MHGGHFTPFVALAILTGCASPGSQDVVTPTTLTARTAELSGREVNAKGTLVFESHARQLWTSSSVGRNANENCVTLIDTDKLRPILTRLNRRAVTVRGKLLDDVLTDNVVDLGACNRVGLLVMSVRE